MPNVLCDASLYAKTQNLKGKDSRSDQATSGSRANHCGSFATGFYPCRCSWCRLVVEPLLRRVVKKWHGLQNEHALFDTGQRLETI